MNPIAQIQAVLVFVFSASWKTTVAGLLYAAFELHQQFVAWQAGQPVNKHAVAAAFAAALLGYVARDYNVSSEQQAGLPGGSTGPSGPSGLPGPSGASGATGEGSTGATGQKGATGGAIYS